MEYNNTRPHGNPQVFAIANFRVSIYLLQIVPSLLNKNQQRVHNSLLRIILPRSIILEGYEEVVDIRTTRELLLEERRFARQVMRNNKAWKKRRALDAWILIWLIKSLKILESKANFSVSIRNPTLLIWLAQIISKPCHKTDRWKLNLIL